VKEKGRDARKQWRPEKMRVTEFDPEACCEEGRRKWADFPAAEGICEPKKGKNGADLGAGEKTAEPAFGFALEKGILRFRRKRKKTTHKKRFPQL